MTATLENVIGTIKGLEGLGQTFVQHSEQFWLAKEVLFSGYQPERREEVAQDYRILASFRDFNDFKSWYSRFFRDDLNRRRAAGKIDKNLFTSMYRLEQELRVLRPDDPTVYPIYECDLDNPLVRKCKTVRGGGDIRKVIEVLPDDTTLNLVAKRFSPDNVEQFQQEKEIHAYLAERGFPVSKAESHSDSSLLLTYLNLGADLDKYLSERVKQAREAMENGDTQALEQFGKEHKELLLDVLMKNLQMGLDLYETLFCQREQSPKDKKMRERLERGKVTRRHLVNEFDNYVVHRCLRTKQGNPKKIQRVPLDKALVKAYSTIAEEIVQLPYFPTHGDLWVGNVFKSNGSIVLHDVELKYAPLFYDLFDLLTTGKIESAAMRSLVDAFYFKLAHETEQRNVSLEQRNLPLIPSLPREAYTRGFHLVSVDRGLRKAAQYYMMAAEEENPDRREGIQRMQQRFYTIALKSLSALQEHD